MSDIDRRRGLFDPEEDNLEGDPEEGNPEEGDPEEGNPEEGDREEAAPEAGNPEKGDPEDDDVWQLSQIYKKRDRSYQKGREAATEYLHMQSTELCLASSEILTPHPLSTPASVSSPRTKGGRVHFTLARG
jgi:hypothetical protein